MVRASKLAAGAVLLALAAAAPAAVAQVGRDFYLNGLPGIAGSDCARAGCHANNPLGETGRIMMAAGSVAAIYTGAGKDGGMAGVVSLYNDMQLQAIADWLLSLVTTPPPTPPPTPTPTPTPAPTPPATPQTIRILEYYNRILNHYFVTAEGGEAAGIDAGAAGPGWERTGLSFTAWPLDASDNDGTRLKVCRFYGSPTIGPNSHFYAIEGPECEGLKEIAKQTPDGVPRWNYEGYAFRVEATDATGTCPAGRVGVIRHYNDGFTRRIDSNHRYTIRSDVSSAMSAAGWPREGIVFCALL